MYKPSGSSSTKSIRVDDEIIGIIGEEAESKNLSDNALIENILTKYVVFDRHFEDYPLLVIFQSILTSFLEKISLEDISEIGYRHGLTTPKNIFLMEGLSEPSLESVLWFLENDQSKYSKWFNFHYHEVKNGHIIHLTHTAGAKWSCFLSAYMKGMFKEMLGLEISVDESPSFITIRL